MVGLISTASTSAARWRNAARRSGPAPTPIIATEGLGFTSTYSGKALADSSFSKKSVDASPSLGDVVDSRVASYRAWRFKVGAGFDIVDRVLISGSYGWAGDLTVDPQDPEIPSGEIDMPSVVDLGASATLTRNILLTVAGGWAGWSRVDGVLADVTAYDARWGGAGIEYRGLRLLGLDVPLRFGGRAAELPFAPEGAAQATETAFGGGLGLEFRAGLAAADVALEFGRRGDLAETGLEESFRRLTVSFTVRQ